MWSQPGAVTNPIAWTPLRIADYKPVGKLVGMSMPETGISNSLSAVNMTVLSNGNAVFDMGANIVGVTVLMTNGPANATITLRVRNCQARSGADKGTLSFELALLRSFPLFLSHITYPPITPSLFCLCRSPNRLGPTSTARPFTRMAVSTQTMLAKTQ